MRTIRVKRGKKGGSAEGETSPLGGFTIVELLTVMSIIILLISLLMPALTRVRRYAQFVKQKAQFHAIGIALDLFNSEQQGYPPSDRLDTAPAPGPFAYCGAMKLAEAMVGQDILGFNPDSVFRRDGLDSSGTNILYPVNPGTAAPTYPQYVENIKSRRMYVQSENANAFLLTDIYTVAHLAGTNYGGLNATDANRVICDVYVRTMATGNKTGMPVLYYKADTSKVAHLRVPPNPVIDLDKNIYDSRHNQDLVDIPLPWVTPAGPHHPMAMTGWTTQLGTPTDEGVFYDKTQDKKITTGARPYRADSYILMSAGFDGEYGTKDDVFNYGE